MKNISTQQQVLVLAVISLILLGVYGYFRYMPQQKVVNRLSSTLKKNINQVKNPKFPEEPVQEVSEVKKEAEALELVLVNLRAETARHEQNLAPTDSQDVLLKISEAARTAGVKVIESVPYIVKRKDGTTNVIAKPKQKKRVLKKLRRKRMIAARKKGASRITKQLGTVGAIPKEGELIDRLINDLDQPRPLQRISIEGPFVSLQKFIKSLQIMPWQLTVVKLDIDVNIQTPPPGLPQPLLVRLIVAL